MRGGRRRKGLRRKAGKEKHDGQESVFGAGRRFDHRQARARRGGRKAARSAVRAPRGRRPPDAFRHARPARRPLPRHAGFRGNHRFGLPRPFRSPRPALRTGSRRRLAGNRRIGPPDRRGGGTRRRRRQNPLSQSGHGPAHERGLRGRHGGVHRPDGRPAAHRRRRAQRAGGGLRDAVPHRVPLRRVRQDRRGAPAQRGRRARRPRRLHPSGRGGTDHRRAGLRQPHPGQGRLPRRAAAFPARTAQTLRRHAPARARRRGPLPERPVHGGARHGPEPCGPARRVRREGRSRAAGRTRRARPPAPRRRGADRLPAAAVRE